MQTNIKYRGLRFRIYNFIFSLLFYIINKSCESHWYIDKYVCHDFENVTNKLQKIYLSKSVKMWEGDINFIGFFIKFSRWCLLLQTF